MADDKQSKTHPSKDRFNFGTKGQADLERTYGWRKERNREMKSSDPDGDGDVDSPLDQLMIKRRGYIQQIFKKIIDEADMKKTHDSVGKEDSDINNNNNVDPTDSYLLIRRAAIASKKGNAEHAKKLIALARAAREK